MTWPALLPFNPSEGAASPALEALLQSPGSAAPVCVLAVGPTARRAGWAAPCAIALADAFAARGQSVILADLSLALPELHTLLAIDNDEGLTDVFLFGASLEHVLRTVPGKWFRLIPASGFTPDTCEVLAHARWRGVLEELGRNHDKLLVYLPLDQDCAGALADRSGHVIVLADRSELEHVRSRLPDTVEVTGVLTTPEPARIEAVATAATAQRQAAHTGGERRAETDFEKIRILKDSAREALIADLRARQRAALLGPPPAMTPLPADESEPPPHTPAAQAPGEVSARRAPPVLTVYGARPTPRGTRRWLPWLLVALLVLVVAAAAWYLWSGRFAQTRRAQATPQSTASPAREPAAPAQPAASVPAAGLPWAVTIASYQDLEVALDRLDQIAEQAPELPFFIGPVTAQGAVYYRIMAGPLADSGHAVLLRDTLLVKRIKTISSGWDVLSAPYAFLLGEHATREEAEAQQEAAVRKGIPSYIVASKNQNGTEQYNLYAGAYTGPGDAEFMRPILQGAGLPDNLVEKTGVIRS